MYKASTLSWIERSLMVLCICTHLDLSDVFLELAWVYVVLKPSSGRSPLAYGQKQVQAGLFTHISSISAGVRRATSGSMNQATTTVIAPAAAKL